MTIKLFIKKFLLVLLLAFFTMQGCVKFEPDEVAKPGKLNESSNKVDVVVSGDEDVKKNNIATHQFELGTVFSFSHIVKLKFEIDSSVDSNSIRHIISTICPYIILKIKV